MLEKAKRILAAKKCSCALVTADKRTYTATGKGIMPLLSTVNKYADELIGCAAADKIVGKGAAILLCDVGASAVYAEVMSESALTLFKAHGVKAQYGVLVPTIINRAGNDSCPLEKAVADCDSLDDGKLAVYEFAKSLMK